MNRRCKRIPPHVLFVLTWGTASKRTAVFPKHPATTGRRFCRGCSRWLTNRFWTSQKGDEDCRCDTCMRDYWRQATEKSRAKARAVARNVTMPKGWGF